MAVGVPQITDHGPGTPDLIENPGFGRCIAPTSPTEAADAVNRLLGDENARIAMGARARIAHLERFNYESEFRPVIEVLAKQVRN